MPPTLTAVTPAVGQPGELITLSGRELAEVDSVRVGLIEIPASDFLEHTNTSISLVVPIP